jgi:16S rRNA (guanine966-N2)-methyltransferase
MRITGGQAKGRRLYLPKGYPVRPTPDKIKEALFNIIPPVEGKRFLDLYAGAGCVGLEALSRGALRAVFVEREPALVHAIRKNIQTCGFSDLAEVISADVKRGIGRLSRQGESFHVLFADPPYDRGLVGETLQMLKESQIMSDDVLVIIQHSVRESSAEIFRDDRLVIADQRRYGDTALSFMRYS